MKKIYFYKRLPEGYEEDRVIDAKYKSTAIKFNLVGILIIIAVLAVCTVIKAFGTADGTYSFDLKQMIVCLAIIAGGSLVYMVLHELVHGLFYKIFTREKLTFGLSLSCAYCGVPDLYLTKTAMLVTVIAPFALFTVFFIPIMVIVDELLYFIAIAFLFASHVGGCVGDLYVFSIIIFKYKGVELLMNDTGPKQTFYVKKFSNFDEISDK